MTEVFRVSTFPPPADYLSISLHGQQRLSPYGSSYGSPYDYPAKHWEFDDQGQPTQKVNEFRRGAEFIAPIPKPQEA